MVHLRIVAPADRADRVTRCCARRASAIDVIRVPDASTQPSGDLVMCDVAREDASVIISDLRELGIHHDGSISISPADTISDLADAAVKHAPGSPADAVIWEELDQRTSESVELSAVFLLYMVLAAIIAAIGIFLDSAILVVGAMVVGPEFGPVAGLCVALVQLRGGSPAARPSRCSSASRSRSSPRSLADAALRRGRPRPGHLRQRRPRAVEDHLEPGRLRVHRRRLRGSGRHAQPLDREVRRADRRPDR